MADTENTSRSAATRLTILEAATAAFASRGYAQASMIDIANQAGTSVGLLYYHFGSKESLFYAIWNDYQRSQEERLRGVIHAAQEQGVDDGLHLLVIGVRAYLDGAWEGRLIYQMAHVKDSPPGFTDESGDVNIRWTKRSQRLIECDDRVLGRLMLTSVMSSLGGMCRELVQCRDDAQAASLIDRSVQLIASFADAFARLRSGIWPEHGALLAPVAAD